LSQRAIKTLWAILEKTDLMWIPVKRTWRLNERHYGGLQGLDKKETVAKHGKDQVMVWRRSYTTPPPLLPDDRCAHARRRPRLATFRLNRLTSIDNQSVMMSI
ncbi:unnamed protein product, partial [Hapterophycus canaliculatus]